MPATLSKDTRGHCPAISRSSKTAAGSNLIIIFVSPAHGSAPCRASTAAAVHIAAWAGKRRCRSHRDQHLPPCASPSVPTRASNAPVAPHSGQPQQREERQQAPEQCDGTRLRDPYRVPVAADRATTPIIEGLGHPAIAPSDPTLPPGCAEINIGGDVVLEVVHHGGWPIPVDRKHTVAKAGQIDGARKLVGPVKGEIAIATLARRPTFKTVGNLVGPGLVGTAERPHHLG